MEYVDINGKLIRKDPKYYLQDVLHMEEYNGSYDMLEEHLRNISEETEIHFINCKCTPELLLDVFRKVSDKSEYITFIIDD